MKLYELYFGCKVGDQDKRWAPHVCCVNCSSLLSAWYKGTGSGLTFGVPMIWREPLDHSTNCYFCLTDIQGLLTPLICIKDFKNIRKRYLITNSFAEN